MRRWFDTALLAILLLTVACAKEPTLVTSCEADVDCTLPGTRCDTTTKACICVTNEACEAGSFCNTAGVCQAKAGCASNVECVEAGTYCDVATGRCLEGPPQTLGAPCGLASHCPYGAICRGGVCEAGCFDDGDCLLGEICYGGQCAGGEGVCSGDPFCGYGELCKDGQCRTDHRGPYCAGCTPRTIMNPEPCDHPRNFCLVNVQENTGHSEICGVDCSLGQDCPNGYDCYGILILTDTPCTFTAQCRCSPNAISFATRTCTVAAACDPRLPDGRPDTNAAACFEEGHPDCTGGQAGSAAACIVPVGERFGRCTCGSDDDCPGGGACVGGACCTGTVRDDRDCALGENRVSGYCTCATDDDCPRDVCDGSRGACALTGLPCTPGADDCGPIPCVEGACLIGRNCAPIEGLTCSEISGP